MKSWKLVLGAGAACAVCCAAPIASGMAALGIGSGLFAGAGAAVAAYVQSWLPLAAGGIAAAALAAVAVWRRRVAARPCCPACP